MYVEQVTPKNKVSFSCGWDDDLIEWVFMDLLLIHTTKITMGQYQLTSIK